MRWQDRRGRTRQDGVRPGKGVQSPKNLALDLHILGRVFLNMVGARQRLFQRRGGTHASAHCGGGGAIQQIVGH